MCPQQGEGRYRPRRAAGWSIGAIMRLVMSARRAALLAAVSGLGITGLGITGLAAGPAAAAATSTHSGWAHAGSARAAAGLASAQFVTQPRAKAPAAGIRQVCPTPTRPGQMTCMALAPARGRGAIGPATAPPAGTYSPRVLQEAYGLVSAAGKTPPSTETVAIVDAYSDPSASADLSVYRSQYGLPSCTTSDGCLTIVGQDGTSRLPAADPTGSWELEESLDLDMVSAICPNCNILLVAANSASISDLATAEVYATRHAEAVSNSWGSGAEFTGEKDFDSDFYRPGVAITAAAGDSGYGTQYPAASQFVTAVGGTSLTGATTRSRGTQLAWNDTGSGCSALEPRPSWQKAPARCGNRTETDVSADADPATGVAVYDSVRNYGVAPGWTTLGGTSVAAPIIASTYALADIVAGGAHHGLIAGTFPAAYPYQDGGLTDVTAGSDGSCEPGRRYLCHARTGYDGPTGLGTPDGTAGFTGPAAGAVTVIDPGTQVVQARSAARLSIRSQHTGSGGSPAFSATGLPPGMRIGRTGTITGSAPARAGTYHVTVTVQQSGDAAGSAGFALVILPRLADKHPGTGPVRLWARGKCLTRAGARSNARIEIDNCDGRTSQNWSYLPGPSPTSAGSLRIQGRCLSVRPGPSIGAGPSAGDSTGAGATLRPCNGSAGQRWRYRSKDRLANPHSDRCLADPGGSRKNPGGSRKNGKRVALEPCGAAGESWTLPPAPIMAGIAGRCLEDPGDSAAAGTTVEIARCSSRVSQKWVIDPTGNVMIRGKCLGVSGGSRDDGAAIELVSCTGPGARQWLRGPHGELLNAHSARCLADPENAAASGRKLAQEDCYSEPGEIWLVS